MLMMVAKQDGNLHEAFGLMNVTSLPDPITEMVMVLVRPGLEQEARDAFRRRGVGAWWPNFPREIGAKDRETGKRYKRTRWSGVLPGVVLCKARLDKAFWEALDVAPGAMNVVRKSNTDVVLLSDIDVVLIHKIEQGLNNAPLLRVDHSFAVGDKVRLIDDEYRSIPAGQIVACQQDGRVTAEFQMFGSLRHVELLPSQLEPVDVKGQNQSASKYTDARGRPAKSPSGRKSR